MYLSISRLTVSCKIYELNDVATLVHFGVRDFTFVHALVKCRYVVHHQESQSRIRFRGPVGSTKSKTVISLVSAIKFV